MTAFDPDRLQAPADLEDRVVARLREEGLVATGHTTYRETSMKAIHTRWAVAATVLLAAGIFAGTRLPGAAEDPAASAHVHASDATDARPVFALMLYEDAGYDAPAGEAEHEARVAEYSAWAGELASQGLLVDGAELLPGGVLLNRDAPRSESVPAGPQGILAGYFVIRAESLDEAERIAAECPHLEYGGSVSVRPTGASA